MRLYSPKQEVLDGAWKPPARAAAQVAPAGILSSQRTPTGSKATPCEGNINQASVYD